ncbi:glycoside hydrolase family 127 protein [Gracilibacillus timonensis]|uniref:glycoside hydrolase family 127 protein n=1 Tax=Gracilibacillus timonensis TaxID=1816696 RepID=UPI00098F8DB2|nr:beta-L-arabinofuranosidase domain-containing protein [Gracilibacillus timonensis]
MQKQALPFTQVKITDPFWQPRLQTFKDITLQACIEKCESTGRIANFSKAAGHESGEFEGIFFNDSDVYKVLEGASYSLMNHPDEQLEQKVDQIVDEIAAAQQEDGYLLCYFILNHQDQRWTDMDKHEMYCGGHLIEAAVAYYQATGKSKLLDVACKLADHYDHTFGPGKRNWVPGHPEIELALVRLYQLTEEDRYWKLAYWLLEQRGHGYGEGAIWDREDWGPAYCQDDKPVREITEVKGHAVRAMYLYTAMADVAKVTKDSDYLRSMDAVWHSIVDRNMYITGGIGPSRHNEGFTEDYDLPNESAYCETCASVGMVFWNHRMHLLHGDSIYIDVLERAMYNGALAGYSLSGDTFFYENPLESDGSHHRVAWFDTSCCPTQISRFIPSIGQYVYTYAEKEVWVNLFMESKSTIPLPEGSLRLHQKTSYPWDEKVEISIETQQPCDISLNIRVPGWCRTLKLFYNDQLVDDYVMEKGYISLNRHWQNGDKLTIYFDMPVETMKAHPLVKENVGKIALQRGPLVYCVEQTDNQLPVENIAVQEDTSYVLEDKLEWLNGGVLLKGINKNSGVSFSAIPYYAWDNREAGSMKVWLPCVEGEKLYGR